MEEGRHCCLTLTALSSDVYLVNDVLVAVSKLGCTQLLFVESGVKVDGNCWYYRSVVLKETANAACDVVYC